MATGKQSKKRMTKKKKTTSSRRATKKTARGKTTVTAKRKASSKKVARKKVAKKTVAKKTTPPAAKKTVAKKTVARAASKGSTRKKLTQTPRSQTKLSRPSSSSAGGAGKPSRPELDAAYAQIRALEIKLRKAEAQLAEAGRENRRAQLPFEETRSRPPLTGAGRGAAAPSETLETESMDFPETSDTALEEFADEGAFEPSPQEEEPPPIEDDDLAYDLSDDDDDFLAPSPGGAERRRELDRERADRELELGDEEYWWVCPKCGEHLSEHEFDNIKVERCESCGVVCIDKAEVELLLQTEDGRMVTYRVRGLFQ